MFWRKSRLTKNRSQHLSQSYTDDLSLESILQQARATKGSDLTAEEHANLTKAVGEYETIKEELCTIKNQDAEREEAERVFNHYRQSNQSGQTSPDLKAEREVLLNQLEKLGFRINRKHE